MLRPRFLKRINANNILKKKAVIVCPCSLFIERKIGNEKINDKLRDNKKKKHFVSNIELCVRASYYKNDDDDDGSMMIMNNIAFSFWHRAWAQL